MANDLNKVIIIGNLVKEPDYRDFGNGKGSVCTIRLANSREFVSNGQKQEDVTYIEANAYGKLASVCRQFLSKGSKVLVEGRLHLSAWQNKEGKQNQKIDIVAENVQFLHSRRDEQGNNPPRPPADHPHGRRSVSSDYAPPPMPETNDDNYQADDDMPF